MLVPLYSWFGQHEIWISVEFKQPSFTRSTLSHLLFACLLNILPVFEMLSASTTVLASLTVHVFILFNPIAQNFADFNFFHTLIFPQKYSFTMHCYCYRLFFKADNLFLGVCVWWAVLQTHAVYCMMQALLLMQKTFNYLAFIHSFISFACNISQFGSLIEPCIMCVWL